MTIAEFPFEYIKYVGIAYVILVILALVGIIYAYDIGQYRRYGVPFSIVFVLCLFYMTGIENICVETYNGLRSSIIGRLLREIPIIVMAATLIVCTALIVVLWLLLRRYIRTMLTPASLQEGLDKLPDGIYFGTEDHIPLLINRNMQRIINEALAPRINVTALLSKPIDTGSIRNGCRAWSNEVGTFVELSDGSVWDIHGKDISVRRGHRIMIIQELLAYDITKRYEKSIELEERNRHLNTVNEKLREYSRNLDSITRQKEMLNAKIRLHDDVGRCLLALRAYLAAGEKSSGDNIPEVSDDGVSAVGKSNITDNNRSTDRAHLEDLWKSTIAVLNNESERTDDVDRMAVMRKAADAVGVSLVISGEIHPDMEELVAAAIHECLTNTVKHADGNILTVDINSDESRWTMRITNNGRPPESEIRETGGLGNLRSVVEFAGGMMKVVSLPEFELMISKDK